MSTSKEERVRVAVRVRPFKETAKGCKRIIDMDGSTTSLVNPADPADRKTYSFDYSYWSFDGFNQDSSGKNVPDPTHPRGNQYSDQKRLFDDLGRKMLSDALDGYNSTLFSYGQTGSGKSYSVIGYGPNEGIIPQLCHEIFRTFDEKDWSVPHPVQFEVHLSMLEIYNETVHDLLRTSRSTKGLKVREHPKKGFYADGLSNFLVTSYPEIDKLIKQGTLNRTVVATNMNATSSRSHTIVSLSIVQKKKTKDGEVTTTAVLNIVDLAGSERVSKVGNTSSERFREGIAINQSLQCLGKCIHALAESSASNGSTNPQSNNKRIPYRDSVLTKLLMNALGGNSKTIMIASISPADIHYDETLSTLRYADRAKQIRTRATVNEDPTEKLMRDLKTENQRLKVVLTKGNIDSQWIKNSIHNRPNNPQAVKDAKKKWEDELRAQIAENEREMNQIRTTKKQDNLEPVKDDVLPIDSPIESQPDKENLTGPHLENINMDPLLNGRWLHYLNQGVTLIGKSFSGISGIEMLGPGMQSNHAEISVRGDRVTIKPLTENGRVMVNGEQVDRRVERVLQPNDRLVFGATQMWVFRHPAAVEASSHGVYTDSSAINYDFVLNEIATKSGLDVISDSTERKDSLQEEIVAILPLVEEANEISAEMDKRVKFEIVVVAPQILGNNPNDKAASSQVYIKMRNLEQGMEYLWSKDKFTTRFDYMKEIYRHYQLRNNEDDDEDIDFIVPDDRDPFLESPDATVIIGVARISLQSLAYSVEMQEQVPITDLRGAQIGFLEIAIIPCADAKGNPLSEDHMVDSIDQLIGRNLYFEFHIINCRNLPPKFRDLHCKYKFYGDKVESRTEMFPHSSIIQFNYHRMLRCEPATRDFIDFLNHGSVVIELLGKHDMELLSYQQPYSQSTNARHSSRENGMTLSRAGQIVMAADMSGMNKSSYKPMGDKKQELLAELQLVKQTHLRIQQRLDFIRQVIDRCLLVGQETIPTTLLDAMLNVNSVEEARQIVQQLQAEAQEGADWMDWNVTTPNNREQRSSVCSIS